MYIYTILSKWIIGESRRSSNWWKSWCEAIKNEIDSLAQSCLSERSRIIYRAHTHTHRRARTRILPETKETLLYALARSFVPSLAIEWLLFFLIARPWRPIAALGEMRNKSKVCAARRGLRPVPQRRTHTHTDLATQKCCQGPRGPLTALRTHSSLPASKMFHNNYYSSDYQKGVTCATTLLLTDRFLASLKRERINCWNFCIAHNNCFYNDECVRPVQM